LTDDKKGPVSDFLDRAREVVDDVVDGVKQQRKSNPVVITGEESIRGAARAGRRIAANLVETAVGLADKVAEEVGGTFSGEAREEQGETWVSANYDEAKQRVELAKAISRRPQLLACIPEPQHVLVEEFLTDLGDTVLEGYVLAETPTDRLLAVITIVFKIHDFANQLDTDLVKTEDIRSWEGPMVNSIWLRLIKELGGVSSSQIRWAEKVLQEIKENAIYY